MIIAATEIIPGFGAPHLEEKFDFLQHNLSIFEKSKCRVDVALFYYSIEINSNDRFEGIKSRYTNGIITITREQGILGEFICKYITNDFVKDYDYIALLLDDILLQTNVDVDKMIDIYEKQSINIISPSLHPQSKVSHDKMRHDAANKIGRYLNILEFFFYIMSRDNYVEYRSVFTDKMKWMWGLPRIFHTRGWRLAILDNMTMIHHYVGSSAAGRYELEDLCRRYKLESEFKVLGYISTDLP